jgi:hypothetical protein
MIDVGATSDMTLAGSIVRDAQVSGVLAISLRRSPHRQAAIWSRTRRSRTGSASGDDTLKVCDLRPKTIAGPTANSLCRGRR